MKYTLLLLSLFYTSSTPTPVGEGADGDGYVPDGFGIKLVWQYELKVWEFVPNDSGNGLEQASIIPVPDYVYFESTETYLILFTFWENGELKSDISYWVGSKASKEKRDAACRFAARLDCRLNRIPRVRREMEFSETDLFKSQFRLLKDRGVRLYILKGQKIIRIAELKPELRSLNKIDTFVVESKTDILILKGEEYNKVPQISQLAEALTQRLQKDKNKGSIFEIHRLREDGGDHTKEFLDLLRVGPGYISVIPSTAPTPAEFEDDINKTVKLLQVTIDEAGATKLEELDTTKSLKLSSLSSEGGRENFMSTNQGIGDSGENFMLPKMRRMLETCGKRKKCKSCKQYSEIMNYELPPDGIVTKWGTWVKEVAVFFADKFQTYSALISELPDDSQHITKVKGCYIFDTMSLNGVHVWIGERSEPKLNEAAAIGLEQWLTKRPPKSLDSSVRVTYNVQGRESTYFLMQFSDGLIGSSEVQPSVAAKTLST